VPETVWPAGDNVTVAVSVEESPRAIGVEAEVAIAEETTRRVSPVSPHLVETARLFESPLKDAIQKYVPAVPGVKGSEM
jgi:hypothetical protein